jgi:hypothetical protein
MLISKLFPPLSRPLFSAAVAVCSAFLTSPSLRAAVPPPVRAVFFVQGAPVPGAGVPGSGIPQGAVWASFGTPAISDSAETAFVGRWVAAGKKEAGIFVGAADGSTARLRAKVGDILTDVGRFAGFRDPQIASDGGVLFFATVQGPAITPETAKVLCYSPAALQPVQLVARVGVPVPGQREILASIGSADLAEAGNVALRGTLAIGGQTSDANDQAAFTWKAGVPVVNYALREGEQIAGLGKVKAFTTLTALPGLAGADLGWFFTSTDGLTHLNARVDFTNGATHVVSVSGGFKTSLASAGVPREGFTPDFRSLALPSFSESGNPRAAYRALTLSGTTGIFHLDPATEFNLAVIFRGQDAPEIPGRKILSLGHPVCSPDSRGSLWFAGVGTTAPEPGRALYWAHQAAPALPELIAREGAPAAGGEPGERWNRISSIALPGGARGTGPVFTASIIGGGVIASEDGGLWAIDSTGALQLILRESDRLNGQTVRSFQVLRATAGAGGVGRSYNNLGQLALLIFYKNGAMAIARIDVP